MGMTTYPTDEHGLIFRSTALAAGYTDNELTRARRRGDLVSVGSGTSVTPAERTPEQLHRLSAIAASKQATKPITLSHQSAATLHQLAMLKPNFRRVHTTTGRSHGAHRSSTRHEHTGTLTESEVVVVDGVRVTSLERTAVDVACTTPHGFAGALSVFDSALRAGADSEVMRAMLRRRRHGVGQARRALHHADGASENPGESWSRAQLIEAGSPIPRLQNEFYDEDGEHVARTDFDWAGLLVAEFDGDVKYRKHLKPGETPFQAMKREKTREDALRKLGIMVIRWTWKDLEKGVVAAQARAWLARLNLMAA